MGNPVADFPHAYSRPVSGGEYAEFVALWISHHLPAHVVILADIGWHRARCTQQPHRDSSLSRIITPAGRAT
jgi:hypothetical protein